MRFKRFAAAALLGISALGLSACATGLRTQVSRYQAMPAPQGESFVVVPANAADMGGLEFSRYADLVAQAMQAQGYARAPSIEQASMVVQLGYGVDGGHTEIVSDPFPRHHYGWGWGWPYPYYHRRSSFFWGWNDPFWWGPHDSGIRSYTYYVSELDMKIRRKADNAALFEGRAKARARTDNLAKTVPSLVQAMFTNFPGNSGETVKITIPPEPKQARAN